MNKSITYKNVPCPVISKKLDMVHIIFKGEQKWIYECSLGYGEIVKNKFGDFYFFDEILHREDGPACEYINGTKVWYKNGLNHRLDGPAVERYDGENRWYINGLLHREDGPAIEYIDGDKRWYQHGKLHRLNGPAVEYYNGHKEWWTDGKFVSKNMICFMIIKFIKKIKEIFKNNDNI